MRRSLAGIAQLALGLGLGIIAFSVQTPPTDGQPGQVMPGLGSAPGTPAQGSAPLPGNEFAITLNAGEWLICVASYSGSDAMELGRQLVLQIRGKYNMAAYLFNRGEEERRLQNEEFARLEKERHASNPLAPLRKRSIRIDDQVAVLVGGYDKIETARREMDKIKKWQPPQLHTSSGNPSQDVVFITREDGRSQEREVVNPFSNAFVTKNPIQATQRGPTVDPKWWDLNRNEKYSLLECQKPLTLLVKQYGGATGLVQSTMSQQNTESQGFLNKLWSGARPGEALDAGGKQAHELARVLRDLSFQAYVLHTRGASLVTVGAFNSLEDPEYKRVTQQLAALQQRLGSSPSGDPFKLNPIPAPMTVPRKQ
jgi:hypothetical protein